MKRSLVLYTLLVGFFACLIWYVMQAGKALKPAATVAWNQTVQEPAASGDSNIWLQFSHNVKSPLGLLLLQIIVILLVCKLFGALFTRLRQPSVVGEMVAGIFLGPSIMGHYFPGFSDFLFPTATLCNLQFLSQVGLALFMFIIGMELDIEKLKNKAHNAIVISHASIVFPYFLGVALSYFLYEQFAPANVSFMVFALFMGIAVSITAFPVLARILQERGLTRTSLGAIVITCAAFDDVTAWCILASVIAIAKAGGAAASLLIIALTLLFVLLMLYVIRPIIRKASDRFASDQKIKKSFVILVFLCILISACITETLGIHALFGAFLAGVIMPQKAALKSMLMEKIEDVSLLLLLPLFFAFTGLRTQIGLLNEGNLWGTCALIITVAVLGKFGGSSITARLTGQSWKESLSIGALMNTRGLMELIVLNIGFDLGILSPAMFAMMVLMALSTTFMTGPLLDLIDYFSQKKSR
jgi:Kef-type K+ transport system membrane component KefB